MQFQYITTNPKVLAGKPIIKGSRISVEFLIELVISGASLQDIVKKYPHPSRAWGGDVQHASRVIFL
ncbi:MAG: DUF433 domain-containing protein [Saprospiraceae bacterium]|nr:DUF433 domain-containing protein [Saprospiraceae bacterium]MCF8252439.1 DUF433 domain-containing protein [Saprospiraceae bacterium]MCF8282286.1 DUF433 domain-containing protein [Bacteroidales bacterium]MCF8314035.1 DUF433 domain-containing protein [Saprospiraceae bacterium]MCF8442769.1 DUF433 domain-containing protein [Saprospiraceae bacterium]